MVIGPAGRGRDVVVAVDAGDLFDQVFLDLHVEAVGRRRDDEVVAIAADLQLEALEHAGHRVGAEVDAEHAAHAAGAQADRRAGGQLVGGDGLDHRAGFAAADVEDQARGALDGLAGQREVDAALEAVGGIRREAVGAGPAGDGVGAKKALSRKSSVVSRVIPLSSPPMMPASARARASSAISRVSAAGVMVWPLRSSTCSPAGAGARGSRRQLGVVEGVQRLAELEHHVVGDVDQGADRADAAARQALLHPLGVGALASTPRMMRPQ
jgi:hypothetical protein